MIFTSYGASFSVQYSYILRNVEIKVRCLWPVMKVSSAVSVSFIVNCETSVSFSSREVV